MFKGVEAGESACWMARVSQKEKSRIKEMKLLCSYTGEERRKKREERKREKRQPGPKAVIN